MAHDWLELGMLSNLGLKNTVIHFLHGAYNYYYELAIKHEHIVDLFIPVAEHIEKELNSFLPFRKDDIKYLRFPVDIVETARSDRKNNIVFLGRLEEAKGYTLLPSIAMELKRRGKNLHWHIIGSPPLGSVNKVEWESGLQVSFYGAINNETVLKVLPEMKILLLPSLFEGMPLSIIEGMKAGVIPIVNDIEGGIQELVINGKTGYKIPNRDVSFFTERIIDIIENTSEAMQLQENTIRHANSLFDPYKNAKLIEDNILLKYHSGQREKKPKKIYGSRLDKKCLPNFIVRSIRNFNK